MGKRSIIYTNLTINDAVTHLRLVLGSGFYLVSEKLAEISIIRYRQCGQWQRGAWLHSWNGSIHLLDARNDLINGALPFTCCDDV